MAINQKTKKGGSMAEKIILRSPLCIIGMSKAEMDLLVGRGCHACYVEGQSTEFVAVISEIVGG
ncbi:MAG: hypothetical protein WC022_03435 [Parcubacteria group bacterium]